MSQFFKSVLPFVMGALLATTGCSERDGFLSVDAAGSQVLPPPTANAVTTQDTAGDSPAEPAFEAELLQAAAEYGSWGRVDDDLK
jgi:hypothetical protein